MRFTLAGSLRSIPQCYEWSKRIEELGYEGFYTADHQMLCLDPFQGLAACARDTSKIKLGTAVTNMVYRDPMILALCAATLNETCNGRAVLGLGTGDGPVFGLGRKATPIAKFEEGIKQIRALLNGEEITLATGKFKLRVGKLPVPVWISVEGPKGLQAAGRVADGVILGGGFDLNVIEWAQERIDMGAREVGRSASKVGIMVAGMIGMGDDPAQVKHLVRRRLANRAHHNFRYTQETVPMAERPGVQKLLDNFDVTKPIEERADPNLITDYLLNRFAIAGSAEECIARVKELEKAGVEHLIMTPPEIGYTDVMERWAKEVMPHFR